jgi:DNA-binding CsgD family transcriptional regulator/tetratricopeptide (TPR) repeat protein
MLQGDALQARAPCEEALRIAREVGASEVECDALNTLGAVLTILGERDDGIEILRQALDLADELGALQELRRSYVNLSQALDDAGRLDEAADLARAGWERLRPRIGTAAAFLGSEAGLCLTRLGRWDEALAVLDEAAEVAGRTWTAAVVLAARAELEALRGELDAATVHLRSAARLAPPADVYWMMVDRIPAARIALTRGHPEELRQIVDLDAPMSNLYPAFLVPLLALALRAEAELADQARAAGDEPAQREAVTRAHTLVGHARALMTADAWSLGSVPQETQLQVELCELEADRARGESHADAWAAHAARWEQLGRPWSTAYARLREAHAALAENLPRGRVSAALAPAHATATRLGARPLLDAIEIVSRQARVRVKQDQREHLPSEVAALTARELDVLRLIADGRTNAEIGKELYMSPKTASVHVSRILSKLDVKTRTQAAGVAHRLALVDVARREVPT